MNGITRSIPLAIAAAIVSLSAASAHATTGHMGPNEYLWVDTTIPDANTQWQVENHCNCDGDLMWNDTRNGNPSRGYKYATGIDGFTAFVQFVKRDDGKWYAYSKQWCPRSGVCSDPVAI